MSKLPYNAYSQMVEEGKKQIAKMQKSTKDWALDDDDALPANDKKSPKADPSKIIKEEK